MQALVIAAAVHEAAREFVDDDDLAVLDDVVNIALHEAPCLHGLIDVVRERGVFGVGQIFHVEELLGLFNALLRERHGAVLFVDNVIAVILILQLLAVRCREDLLFQAGDEIIRHFIQLGRFLALAGNNERGARLVNEDGVNLVDDGERVAALHHLLFVDRHIVAQVIEAQLVICAVGDIGGIGRAALLRGQIVDDEADGQPQKTVDLAHPLRVALGEIIVDRDDVHAPSGQRIQVCGQDRDERLALAGLHFGDAALMQHDAAHDLHPVRAHTEHAVGCLAADGERLRQQRVERLTGCVAILEFLRLCAKFLISQLFIRLLERHDGLDLRFEFFDLSLRAGAE